MGKLVRRGEPVQARYIHGGSFRNFRATKGSVRGSKQLAAAEEFEHPEQTYMSCPEYQPARPRKQAEETYPRWLPAPGGFPAGET